MSAEEWKQEQIKKQKKNNQQYAQYTHFDRRMGIEHCFDTVTSPQLVAKHGFYPFIHCTMTTRKVKNGQKALAKEREIYYAAHLDGWIYRYYAFLLDQAYNRRAAADGIDSVAVAYRTNLRKSNVDFAKEAFDFIQKLDTCYVMIGDFSNFFDTLDHSYLKAQLCSLLSDRLVDGRLPDDYYAIFKNITRFSFVELTELLQLKGYENTKSGRKAFNDRQNIPAIPISEIRERGIPICRNLRKDKGIPQGSPISAVLANVYMLEADKQLQEYVTSHNGFYMRYSDDFIVVLPKDSGNFSAYCQRIKAIISAAKVDLQPEKTRVYLYENTTVVNLAAQFEGDESSHNKNLIEFLGFSFDGKIVRFRDKTISKYYNRMYRKARVIAKNRSNPSIKRPIGCKNLYMRHSKKGSLYYRKKTKTFDPSDKKNRRGNFFDYVQRSKKVFEGALVDTVTPRHMQKINRALKHPLQ